MSGRPALARRGIVPEQVAEIIVTLDGETGRRGSGYRVGSTAVLTAAHVVEGAVSVRMRFNADLPGEWTVEAISCWADLRSDLAVLTIAPTPRCTCSAAIPACSPAPGTRPASPPAPPIKPGTTGCAVSPAETPSPSPKSTLVSDAETLTAQLTEPCARALALSELAAAVLTGGDEDQAVRLAEEAEMLAARLSDPRSQAQVFGRLAGLAAAGCHHDRAGPIQSRVCCVGL